MLCVGAKLDTRLLQCLTACLRCKDTVIPPNSNAYCLSLLMLQGEGSARQLGVQPQPRPSLLLLLSRDDLLGHCAVVVVVQANASKSVLLMNSQVSPHRGGKQQSNAPR